MKLNKIFLKKKIKFLFKCDSFASRNPYILLNHLNTEINKVKIEFMIYISLTKIYVIISITYKNKIPLICIVLKQFSYCFQVIWMGRSRVRVWVIKALKIVLTASNMNLSKGNALAIKSLYLIQWTSRQGWYNSKSWLSHKRKGCKTYGPL